MREAEVNAAAIHYHFGSKDNVLLELITRRLEPVSEKRLSLLDQCMETPEDPRILEQIIEAFIGPVLEWAGSDASPYGRRIHAKLSFEYGEIQKRLYSDHAAFDRRFVNALERVLPHLSPETIYWRFSFMVGYLIYVAAGVGRVEQLSGGLYDPNDTTRAIYQMVTTLSAGFRAPENSNS